MAAQPQGGSQNGAGVVYVEGRDVTRNLQYAKGLGIDVAKEKDLFQFLQSALAMPLMPPWREMVDDQKQIYFWNPSTRETSWVHPLRDVHDVQIAVYRRISLAQDPRQAAQLELEAIREKSDGELSLWREVFAENGQPYYYHVVTRATRWDSPYDELVGQLELHAHLLGVAVQSVEAAHPRPGRRRAPQAMGKLPLTEGTMLQLPARATGQLALEGPPMEATAECDAKDESTGLLINLQMQELRVRLHKLFIRCDVEDAGVLPLIDLVRICWSDPNIADIFRLSYLTGAEKAMRNLVRDAMQQEPARLVTAEEFSSFWLENVAAAMRRHSTTDSSPRRGERQDASHDVLLTSRRSKQRGSKLQRPEEGVHSPGLLDDQSFASASSVKVSSPSKSRRQSDAVSGLQKGSPAYAQQQYRIAAAKAIQRAWRTWKWRREERARAAAAAQTAARMHAEARERGRHEIEAMILQKAAEEKASADKAQKEMLDAVQAAAQAAARAAEAAAALEAAERAEKQRLEEERVAAAKEEARVLAEKQRIAKEKEEQARARLEAERLEAERLKAEQEAAAAAEREAAAARAAAEEAERLEAERLAVEQAAKEAAAEEEERVRAERRAAEKAAQQELAVPAGQAAELEEGMLVGEGSANDDEADEEEDLEDEFEDDFEAYSEYTDADEERAASAVSAKRSRSRTSTRQRSKAGSISSGGAVAAQSAATTPHLTVIPKRGPTQDSLASLPMEANLSVATIDILDHLDDANKAIWLERIADERKALQEKLEAERIEAERSAAEAAERERLEAERRIASEKAEAERLEAERVAAEKRKAAEEERLEAERLEAERLAAEQAEKEQQLEADRIAAAKKAEEERLEAERLEAERLAAEKAEEERLEAARIAEEERKAREEREEAQRLEADRVAAEEAERARLEAERKAEEERLEAERAAAEQRRLEAERLAAEQAEKERLEAERLAAEKAEQERLEAERLAAEQAKMEAERLEAERIAAEKAEQERREAERLEAERLALEAAERERQLEEERIAAERAEEERLEAERAAAEAARIEAEKLAAEKAEKERLEAEQLAAEKAAEERREAERQRKAAADAAAKAERDRLEAERIAAQKAAEVDAFIEAERAKLHCNSEVLENKESILSADEPLARTADFSLTNQPWFSPRTGGKKASAAEPGGASPTSPGFQLQRKASCSSLQETMRQTAASLGFHITDSPWFPAAAAAGQLEAEIAEMAADQALYVQPEEAVEEREVEDKDAMRARLEAERQAAVEAERARLEAEWQAAEKEAAAQAERLRVEQSQAAAVLEAAQVEEDNAAGADEFAEQDAVGNKEEAAGEVEKRRVSTGEVVQENDKDDYEDDYEDDEEDDDVDTVDSEEPEAAAALKPTSSSADEEENLAQAKEQASAPELQRFEHAGQREEGADEAVGSAASSAAEEKDEEEEGVVEAETPESLHEGSTGTVPPEDAQESPPPLLPAEAELEEAPRLSDLAAAAAEEAQEPIPLPPSKKLEEHGTPMSPMSPQPQDLPEVGTATSTQQEAEAATAAVTASVAPPPPAPSQSMDASPRTPASPTVPFSTAQAATTAEAAPAEASPPPAPRQLADASPRTPASPTVTFHPVVAKKPAHLQSDSGSDLETGSHMNDEEEDGVDDAASESSCEPLFFMPRTDIDRQPPVLTRENTQQSVTAMHQRVGEMLIAKRGRKPPDEEDLSSPRSVQTTSPPAGDAAVNELEQVPAEPPALEGPTPSELLCSGPLEEKEVEQLELDDDFADWAGIGAQGGGGEQTKEAAEDFLSSLAQAQDSFEDLVLKHKLAARVRIEEQQSEGEASAAEIEDVHHHKDGKSRRKKSEKQRRSVKIEGQTPAAEASDNEGARHSKRHKKDRQSMHAKQEALGNLIVSPSQRHRSPKPNPPDMKAVYAPQGTLQPVAPPRRRSLSAEAPPVPIRRAGSKRTSPGVNHNGPRQHHLAAEAKYVKMALQESEQGGRLYGAYAHLFDELLGSPPRRRAAPQQQLSPAAAAASPAEEDVLRKRRSSNGLLPEVPDREKARNVSGAAAVAKQQQLVSSPSKLMTDVGRSLAGSQSLPTLIRSQ